MYSGRRVLLIGYGVLGTELLLHLERAGAVVVVILDDRFADLAHEQRVQGPLDLAPEILDTDDVDLVVIGASLIGSGRINWLTGHARRRGIPIYVAPERSEIDSMDRLHEQARVPSIEDLFARSSLEVDWDRITQVVAGRRVLVTGAGGSIGRQTVIQLASHGVEVIGLLDRDDCLLHDVAVELTGSMHDPLHPLFHVDIQHESKVLRAFRDFRPEIVVHAAALKHVTTLETDPSNALAVNVLGTANVLEAAAATGVDLLVNVSTDKAASRIGSLGVSKYIGERMTSAMGVPGYRSVRFGNVIGSRGSVLHTFRLQAEHHGEVAVRGDETTRFFMTPGEAGSLVLSTFAQKSASGTFVFRMGDPVQIRRLAQAVIDDVDVGARIKMTSLEAGEARHEQLFGDDEKPSETDVEEVFRVDPPGLDTSEVRGRLGSLDEVMSLTVEAGRALLEELAEC